MFGVGFKDDEKHNMEFCLVCASIYMEQIQWKQCRKFLLYILLTCSILLLF